MKHFITLLIFFFAIQAQGKTTYIPSYANRLILIENGKIDTTENQQRVLSLPSQDGTIRCSLVQQVVTPELVKAIKSAKSAAGWAMVAAGFSAASAGYSIGRMNSRPVDGFMVSNYVNAHELTGASLDYSASALAQAEDLKMLYVDLLVKNDSEKELLITDMDKGLVWFVMPHNEMALHLSKGEEGHFRVAPCSALDENVKYINAVATSTMEKYTIGLETDLFWYIPMTEKAVQALQFPTYVKDGYIRVDKETMRMKALTKEEFNAVKNSRE
jgi:hypothetical protein